MFGEFYGGDSAPCGERRDTGEGSGKARGVRGYDKGRVRAFLLAFVWVAEDSSESSVPSVVSWSWRGFFRSCLLPYNYCDLQVTCMLQFANILREGSFFK